MLRELKILYVCISLTLLATISLAADFGDNPTPLTQTQISQLYVSIFGRASEGEGNAYWQSEQSDMTVAANTMLNTEPAEAYFGDTLNLNQMFIEFIYKNTLGKDYAEDPTGVDYWVSELAGGKSKGQVVATLINAAIDPQYAGLAAQDQFLNKVTVSNYTADTIATVPDVNDLTAFVSFISGVTDDPETVVDAKAAVDEFSPPGSGSPPQGAFWSEFTVPDPGPVDLGGGVVVNDPSRVQSVIIIEDSTSEILGDCFFGDSDSAATGPSGSDGGQFWCSRNGNTITISSAQANLPKIHAKRVSTLNTNLVMWDISNIFANGGLHAPGGEVYADPYTHKEFQFAGFKKLVLISKTFTIAKKHAREPLENAGYSDLKSEFISPTTEIDVTTLDARKKLEDDVILKQHWKLVPSETRGNLGTYEWKDKYIGTAKATMTFPNLDYKVWEIEATDITFEIDPTYTTMASDTVVYRTTGGTITQISYTSPVNVSGCYGIPASFTDTYDIYPGDGYLSIFPGTDSMEYHATASISLSTPVQDHPYQECCSWRTPACEDAVMEAGGQEHEWLRTGENNSRLPASTEETLQGSYATPPYSTPSYEWNLAPVYDNQ